MDFLVQVLSSSTLCQAVPPRNQIGTNYFHEGHHGKANSACNIVMRLICRLDSDMWLLSVICCLDSHGNVQWGVEQYQITPLEGSWGNRDP